MKFVQKYIAYFLRLIFKLTLKVKVIGEENISLNQNKPLIIVFNHPSRVDPFLLTCLSPKSLEKVIPAYFPTAKVYFNKIWLKWLIKPLGAYPLPNRGWTYPDYLSETLIKLKRKETILIFPEGKLSKTQNEGKGGIVYLATESGAQILPIHIKGLENPTLIKIFTGKQKVQLIIGKAFSLENNIDIKNFRAVSNEILQKIYSL